MASKAVRRETAQARIGKVALAFTLAACCATQATAQNRSGWELFRQSSLYAQPDTEAPNAEVFVAEFNGYLWGAAQVLEQQGVVCLPDNVPSDKLWLPIFEALKANPEQRQRSRADLVAELLPALYPCAEAELP